MSARFAIWTGFGAMCLGMFMAILDIQVVATSLTNIRTALNVSPDNLSWIQTDYLIAEVVAIPLTAWLTRLLSVRWMFAAATMGFTLSSLACALSGSIAPLLAVRVLQGFCGGMLIPAVFTSIFVLIPERDRVLATTVAGTAAVIAPTIGPAIGGYLTQTFSWHMIFLINIAPGILVTILVISFVRSGAPDWSQLRKIDYASIVLAAIFLGSLELLLKDAPKYHWQGAYILAIAATCATSGIGALFRCLSVKWPFVDLREFRERSFALGCALSFIFGIGLYGSTYLISIFLGAIRGHTALEIGEIMMVSGAAQLLVAPVAAVLETRVDARLLTGIGFGMFGASLIANGFTTVRTDFDGLFWQQVVRGASVMLCILPATRLALASASEAEIPNASALFNLMRNLGGAIGIALIDTILEQRTPGHVEWLAGRLEAGDPNAARIVGLPTAPFHNQPMGPVDPIMKAIFEPMVRKAGLAMSFNEAWLIVGGCFVLSLLALPLMRRTPPPQSVVAGAQRVF